jgi:HEAT repeat protein
MLVDTSPLVRVAAAQALCELGQVDAAMPVLVNGLQDPTPYVRLRAMNALDRLGEEARSVLPAIRAAAMKRAPYPAEYLNRMSTYVLAEQN